MRHTRIVVTHYGGPEELRVVEEQRLPLAEARQAHELLGKGGLTGRCRRRPPPASSQAGAAELVRHAPEENLMDISDVLELFDYDRWANARVLAIASSLSGEKRSAPFPASFVSVHGTLAHILWSEWVWLGRWTRLRSTTDPRTVQPFDLLRRHWSAFETEQRTFLEGLAEADLGRLVSYQNPPGTTWTYSLRHMLQHVVNHSTYHRGQLTTMFRELGAAPRPLDFLDYFDEAAARA